MVKRMLLPNITWIALQRSEILHAQGRILSILIYRIIIIIIIMKGSKAL